MFVSDGGEWGGVRWVWGAASYGEGREGAAQSVQQHRARPNTHRPRWHRIRMGRWQNGLLPQGKSLCFETWRVFVHSNGKNEVSVCLEGPLKGDKWRKLWKLCAVMEMVLHNIKITSTQPLTQTDDYLKLFHIFSNLLDPKTVWQTAQRMVSLFITSGSGVLLCVTWYLL